MKKLTIALTALAFSLVGCSSNTEPAPTPSISATSSSSETSEATSSTEPSSAIENTEQESKDPEPTTASPHADAPVAEAPAVEQAPTEPVVMECLEGTPGPALWSDGTISYSQWCFDTMGGEQYLEDEGNGGASPMPEQQQLRGPSPWVQGQIDWTNCLDSGRTPEQCREELN